MLNLIDFILKNQNTDGSFSDNGHNFPTLIFSSLILIELKNIKNNETADVITKKLKTWVLQQKNKNHDLVTTFIINAAVFEDLDGGSLGKILNILTKQEVKPGGPYKNEQGKIDYTLNIAIAYFLSLNKVKLKSLDLLINKKVEPEFLLPKQASLSLTSYLLAKFYQDPLKEKLAGQLFKNSKNLNGLNKALALSAAHSLGKKVTPPKIIEPQSALEALIYLNLKSDNTTANGLQNEGQEMINKILIEAKKRFSELNSDLKKIVLTEIKKTITNNKDRQMSLISYYFKLALGSKGQVISNNLIARAGLANVFFWTAFIIYDDFWDEDEAAKPSILPGANLMARDYIYFYNEILKGNHEFTIFFHSLMDKLDAANTWENLYCRAKIEKTKFIIPAALPDYKNYELKFWPAAGQVLGPVIILIKLGFELDSPEIHNLIEYFKNYLIAMQINDDAHDWVEDLKRGHLSTVTLMLVNDWKDKYPDRLEIDLINDLSKLQELFWFRTLERSCQTVLCHTEKSRKYLKTLDFIEDFRPMLRFVDIAENVAKQALNEQKRSLDLLKELTA